MTSIELNVRGACAKATANGPITSGMVGVKVHVSFDSAWDGLAAILICSNGIIHIPMAIDGDGNSAIPWECNVSGRELNIGVRGVSADGSVVIPTVWATVCRVKPSVEDVELSGGKEPTVSIVDQIAEMAAEAATSAAAAQTSAATAQSIAQSVRADADAGRFDGEPGAPGYSPSASVQREADGARITITDKDGTTTAKVYDGQGGGGGDVPAWVTPEKPDVSYFNNDAGYLTQHQSLAGYATKTELNGKQDKITDIAAIRSGAAAGATALQPGQIASWAKQPTKPSYTAQEVGALPNSTVIPPDLSTDVNELKDKVKDIELFKFPNATITGTPLIESGQVSGFSAANYLTFPFILDVRSLPFSVDFCFTTGADVTTQQNILDSAFGLALAIRNGRGLMALSSDGQSFNLGQVSGTYPIAANHTYYARLSWDRAVYRTALSVDGVNYTNDMAVTSAAGLFPTTIYIGGSPDLFGAGTAHPFTGSINLNKSFMSINGQVFWHGMDDAGLSTRASVSLDNLDAKGEERFKTDPTFSVPGMPADAAETGQALSSAFENLYVLSDDVSGYITTSGSVAAASSTQVERTSDFISVKAGELYTVQVFQEGSNPPWLAMAAFDSSYQFVSRIVGSLLPTYSERTDEFGNLIPKVVFEVPDGIAYIRFSARTYNGTIFVVKGTAAPPNFRLSKKDERLRSNPKMYSNFTPSKPRIILHRGYNMLAPEESIPAYIKGGKAGAWGMECDLQITKDGKFVLMHDSTVDRMTNGSGKISELTLQQIREFRIDVGAGIETLSDNEKLVPTLEEYLRICKYYGSVAVIEMKWDMTQAQVREMVNAIRLFNMQDSCIIVSFLAKDLKLVNLTAPEMVVGFMPANDLSNIEDARALSNLIINVNQNYVNQQLVDSAHVSGILVGSWSTSSEGRITELATLGVDFITIDEHPNVLSRQNDGWELKGTITSSAGITVDLTGCTELIITGIVNATGSSFLGMDSANLIADFSTNGTREWFSHWKDILNGMECISSKYNTSGIGTFRSEGGGYSILSRKISSINEIFFRTPEVITSCDLKIYAR